MTYERSAEVEQIVTRTHGKMKQWGVPLSFLAGHLNVSRQYAWQVVNSRTFLSPARAREIEGAVDAIIAQRRHMQSIGERLRAARLAAGLTLKQAAAMIGYSWVGVERWERNVCLPKPGVIWHLLSVYGDAHPDIVRLHIIDPRQFVKS